MAIGIAPTVDFANSSQLEIDPKNGGIVVNAELQARSDLYAVCLLFLDTFAELTSELTIN
jgi:NAD(P)H-nitrite reductase large subunit